MSKHSFKKAVLANRVVAEPTRTVKDKNGNVVKTYYALYRR